jgi:hypothetical protein
MLPDPSGGQRPNQTPERDGEDRIGFLALLTTNAKDGFIGALLVTDDHGIPQEFRCTHAVKPTLVQRSLYGDTLEPHIGVNLCGTPLLKALQRKPSLVLVRTEYMLEVRSTADCPTVLASRVGDAIEVAGWLWWRVICMDQKMW